MEVEYINIVGDAPIDDVYKNIRMKKGVYIVSFNRKELRMCYKTRCVLPYWKLFELGRIDKKYLSFLGFSTKGKVKLSKILKKKHIDNFYWDEFGAYAMAIESKDPLVCGYFDRDDELVSLCVRFNPRKKILHKRSLTNR